MSTAASLPLDKHSFALGALGGLPTLAAFAIVERMHRRVVENRMTSDPGEAGESPLPPEPPLFAGRRSFSSGETGVSFETLLVPYLRGARRVVITDKYMYSLPQIRNLRELVAAIAASGVGFPMDVELVTSESDPSGLRNQFRRLSEVQDFAKSAGIRFSVTFQNPSEMHPRFIESDAGWVIDLDRGLDIYRPGPPALRPEQRRVRTFVVNYTRDDA
ncbi:MIT C-terminal domain-containing protein [Isoptericola haloaureus]|uniref:MIT C-terminal domain-containing protein n=1 Tax=Isoptericola haloaureus TaxID=1542902 RepID=A0ABU7Z5G1_9MICO